MTPGQQFIAGASAFTSVAGIVLVATYSSLAPWWRSTVGRMMMGYAVSLTILSFLVLLTVGFGVDTDSLRILRGTLLMTVGLAMVVQTALIIREQTSRRPR